MLGNLDGALQLLEALWKLGGSGVESGIPLVAGLSKALAGLMALAFGAARPTFEYDGRYGSTTGPWTTAMFVEAAYRDLGGK